MPKIMSGKSLLPMIFATGTLEQIVVSTNTGLPTLAYHSDSTRPGVSIRIYLFQELVRVIVGQALLRMRRALS